MLIKEIPFEEILEASDGPFDIAWTALVTKNIDLILDRETAKQLLGAEYKMRQIIQDYAPENMSKEDKSCLRICSLLIIMALNTLTGWREQMDDRIGEEFNDCENYDDPFAPEWDDEEEEDDKPAKELWSRR